MSLSSYAQNLVFNHYGLTEGLPQETIHCITKDENGFLWLGTSDGVVRFDGHDFWVPLPDNSTNIDIAGYRIGAIQAFKDKVYIGTGQNGLLAFNTTTEAIEQIHLSNTNCTRIISNNELVIAAYYNQGLVVIKNGEVIPLTFNIDNPKEIQGISIINNTVYLGSKNGHLYSFQIQPEQLERTITLKEIDQIQYQINNLVVIDNSLFICSNNGIYQLDNSSKPNRLQIDTNRPSEAFKINDFIKIEDAYFVATTEGLLKCNLEDYKISVEKHFKAGRKYDEYTINSDNTYALFYDNDLLYIGNINLDITAIKSNPVFRQPTDRFNLNNPSVFAVIDTENYLFIGSSSGLIISNNQNPDDYNILPEYRIRGFTKDNENYIWFATNKGAFAIPLDGLDINNPEVVKLPVSGQNPLALPNENLRSVYTDHNNETWVVTYDSGFSKFTGSIQNNDLRFKNYSSEEFPSLLTLSMVQDQNNDFWMCTQKGLSQFKIDNGVFQLIKNYDETDGLATRGVLSAFIDSDQQLWVASRKGLNKYLPKNNRFKSYGKRDGLTNTFIYNITEDRNKNLWLSSNGGLFRFNTSERKFTNYSPKDGVQSTEFNLGAVYKNAKGDLYFGGINGLNIFDSDRIDEFVKEGQLAFTTLDIKGKMISPQNSKLLSSSIIGTEELDVNHNDFPINISFTALNFNPDRSTTYVYKLLPDDDSWNTLNDKNNIQLLSLSPKSYTLQIQGQSRNQLWQTPPLELQLDVNPPWYQSNMAYLMYLLLFLAIVYAFYTISLQRQIAGQESKRLKDLDDLKSRLITNITHEFRTPLTIILGYLGNLNERFSNTDDINTSLQTIEQNSNNLLNLVNQMLDLTKLEQGSLSINMIQNDMVDYIKHLINSFSGIANEKSIALEFESEEEALLMDFDAEKMRQIISNLISNAIKFSSEDSTVTIHLKREKDMAFISIEDQGVGISDEELPHIFDRFFQVENQGHKVSQGTGIGLALTKELVNLLNGTITVTSKVNKGTTFTMTLPITNSAEQTSLEFLEHHIKTSSAFVPETDDVITQEDTNSVLIVEDNRDMARYIASCLQPQYSVSFAKNGLEGFEKAQQLIPDIIITDVMMPVMDGFELTQKLQSQLTTNHIPIIMLTSKATHDDKMEGIFSGADAYLTKPFEKQELLLRMQMLISKRERLQKSYAIDNIKNRTAQEVPDKNMVFLNKVIAIIHEHIEDSSFNATQLAKTLAMSDSQLYRKLKAISNSSTAIFIRKVRLEKGKELLKTTNLSISEIAYAIGFNDPNWFSKTFKEAFEQSPSEFRN